MKDAAALLALEFSLYLREWETDQEMAHDFGPELLGEIASKRFIEEQAPHSGDCTKQPWTCIRCVSDSRKRHATKLFDALKLSPHWKSMEPPTEGKG